MTMALDIEALEAEHNGCCSACKKILVSHIKNEEDMIVAIRWRVNMVLLGMGGILALHTAMVVALFNFVSSRVP